MPDDVDTMPAGPELDALCATGPMGWHKKTSELDEWWLDAKGEVQIEVSWWQPSIREDQVATMFFKLLEDQKLVFLDQIGGRVSATGHPRSLALCRALVKAFDTNEDNG